MAGPFLIYTRNGIADAGQEAALAALETRLKQPDAKLMLFLHGGLVDEASGKAAALRLSAAGDDSWKLDPEWTQLYVVWRTGAFETLKTNWTDLVHDDRLYQVVLRKLLEFVARKLSIPVSGGARSASEQFALSEAEIQRRILGHGTEDQRRDPFAEVDVHLKPDAPVGSRASVTTAQTDSTLAIEFEGELATNSDFQKVLADLDAVANEGLAGRGPVSPRDLTRGHAMLNTLSGRVRAQFGPLDTLEARTARGPVSVGRFLIDHARIIAYRCFKRFRAKRDHGFQATVVEELCRELYGDLIGAKVWGMMVQDAADHFTGHGFGGKLLDMLGRVPQPTRFAVTGHSAGSIWASRMLLDMAHRGIDRKLNLFLLAPAVRASLFAETIDLAGDRIQSCRMFTMTDALERKDAVLGHDKGYIYPSSLLYLVSGLFEEKDAKAYADAPLLGMRRFAGAPWLDADEAAVDEKIGHFFSLSQNDITLSPDPGVCEADCHGCFNNEATTLKNVAALY
ncbi:hypothetical protein [Acetobacter aceti]|uniref:Alpha/beta hydrolase n=1 Tax=Acetobacter aceti TaxID=435 RepID=A0A6S6PLP0_ACEAC|nr:hypothetical protein [Acetobacter aceti]BCI68738.1 hypothetical protein AAJCM20276_33620 [Acetobacter aceti]